MGFFRMVYLKIGTTHAPGNIGLVSRLSDSNERNFVVTCKKGD
jgi:hypothetical protein